MGQQGRERIARDFSLAAYTGLFARLFRSLARLVIESPSAWRQIFVRMEIYFCAHKKIFPCARKFPAFRTAL